MRHLWLGCLCVLGIGLYCRTALAGERVNLLDNGGFEFTRLVPWQWNKTDTCQATGELDKTEHHSGYQSFKMTNASAYRANVYTTVFQKVPVEAGKRYRVSLWCKGKGVGSCWVGGGKNWSQRKALPQGDFDWTQVQCAVTADDTTFDLHINVESTTAAFWLDDVEMTLVDAPRSHVADGPSQLHGLAPAGQLYPLPATGLGPMLQLRDATDTAFGADVAIGYEPDGMRLDVRVFDPTPGPAVAGENMWQQDCIQLGIDTDPTTRKTGYTGSCFELGFALLESGKVGHYAWQSGGGPFDFGKVQAEGKRENGGYRLRILLDWKSLGLDGHRLPDVLGMDVVIWDGRGPHGRRVLEWTPGITMSKEPDEFAHLIRVKANAESTAEVRLDQPLYGNADDVVVQVSEYAQNPLPAETLTLLARGQDGSESALAKLAMPAIPGGDTRQYFCTCPAATVAEGTFAVVVHSEARGDLATTSMLRLDIASHIPPLLSQLQRRLQQLQSQLKDQPAIAGDAYVQLGVATVARYLPRVGEGGPDGRQSAPWSWLQLTESGVVLEQTAQRMADLNANGNAVASPLPPIAPLTVKSGVWERAGDGGLPRPCYLYGYVGWGQVITDLPAYRTLGTCFIQQENGPNMLDPDLKLSASAVQARLETFHQAAANGVRVDFLLAPHYFPQWALQQTPDIANPAAGGFIQGNIDHPKHRQIVEAFLRQFIPLIKDEPALLSFCLSNEPIYRCSGMDAYSRPAYEQYLRETHHDIATLNALYHANYQQFADVPVPTGDSRADLGRRRAYFDWLLFNQRHLADWHAWMNGIIKQLAPTIPTHIKVMATIFDRFRLSDGSDPELYCDLTDLAGNDCVALPAQGGPYPYHWKLEECWYELLHSFRGQVVIDSENHLIVDGAGPQHIPAAQTRAVLWQGALHHQGAAAIWVWNEPHLDAVGSIYMRPANLYAAGQTMLDLNRLAPELALINRDRPKVALLYSVPAIFWEDDCGQLMQDAFAAINFLGQPVTFISEKQLAEGRRSAANEQIQWIVLPHATHVRQSTVDALARFVAGGGHVLYLGGNCLAWDEYHQPRILPNILASAPTIAATTGDQPLADALRPALAVDGMQTSLLQDQKGVPAFGIEYRLVKNPGGYLLPMTNLLSMVQVVKLPGTGTAKDLLNNETVELSAIKLAPMQPRLLLIASKQLAD